MRWISFLSGLLAAGAAQASCPTLGDLRDGITLVQNAPFFRRADFQIIGGGLQESVHDTGGFGPANMVRFLDHGLAPLSELIGGTRVALTYDGDVQTLSGLESAGEIVLTGTQNSLAGAQALRRDVAWRFEWLDRVSVQMGSCQYDAWRVARTRLVAGGTDETRHDMVYAPGLGLVLARWHVAGDGKAALNYAYSWIGTKADVTR